MEGFLWNNMKNYNSSKNTDDLESYWNMPQWDEILDFPIRHSQRHDQLIPQDIHKEQQIRNMQSEQSCASLQQSSLPSTRHAHDSLQNQLIPQDIHQEQQIRNMQSQQLCASLQQISLHSTRHAQDSFQNQMSPQKLQRYLLHQNLQSIEPCASSPLGQLPPTDGQVSFQNQLIPQDIHQEQHIHNMQSQQSCASIQQTSLPSTMYAQDSFQNQENLQRDLSYHIPQHPHLLTNQATLSVPNCVIASDTVVDMVPASTGIQQQNHQQLPPQVHPQAFPLLLAQSVMSVYTPELFMKNQEHKSSSQMGVVQQPTEPNPDKLKVEVMQQYARSFKMRRNMLGLSQQDVVLELFNMYKEEVSRKNISKFETFNLSLKKMCDLKFLLDRWMANIEASLIICQSLNTFSDLPCKTKIIASATARQVLEKSFLQNPNPAVEEIEKLAKSLTVDKESVRIWFHNRREVLHWIQYLTICTMESGLEIFLEDEQLEQFAKTFKQRRMKLGLSQTDVSWAISKLCGNSIGIESISQFENVEMSFHTMRKLIPMLQKSLNDMEDLLTFSSSLSLPVASTAVSVSYQSPISSATASTILHYSSIPTDQSQQTIPQTCRVSVTDLDTRWI